jgi:hypothetical protein
MAQYKDFAAVYGAYADTFPGTMPDHRAMSGDDFDNLEALMRNALARGSAIVESDLSAPVTEPDPETGLLF